MGNSNYTRKPTTEDAWQLQEAKACFSEVVRRAQIGPQYVTVHGKEAAVVVSIQDFEQMRPQSKHNLAELMSASPLAEIDFGESKDTMPVREVEL